MNSGINLVVKRVDPKTQELQKRIRIVRLSAFILLTLVAAVSLILFIFIAASPLPNLRKQEEELFLSLNNSNTTIQRALFVDKQLNHVQKILSDRSNFPDVVDLIFSAFPQTLSIVTYSALDKRIDMTVQGTSLSDMEKFLDTMTTLSEQKQVYANITISDISVLSSNTYQFRLEIQE